MDQRSFLTPTTCFTVACVAFSFLAVSTVWRTQQSTRSSGKVQTLDTPPHGADRHQIPARPSYRRRVAVDSLYADDAEYRSPEGVIEHLLERCASVSDTARSYRQSGALRVMLPSLAGEVSLLTATLCQLQEAMAERRPFSFPRAASRRAFEAVTSSLAEILLTCVEELPLAVESAHALEAALQQLPGQRSILIALSERMKAADLPPTPSETVFLEPDGNPPAGSLSSFEPSTGLTPAIDARGWIEPPPEYSPPSDPTLHIGAEKGDTKSTVSSPPAAQSDAKDEVFDTDALYNAVTGEEVDLVADLLEMGADPNGPIGELQRTSLHQAAHTNHVPCLAVLLKHGASLKIEDAKGDTALHLAAWAGHCEAILALLTHGADVDWLSGRDGYSALWCAISAYHIDAARLLLKHGARVSLRSASGSGLLPLHQAAVTGQSAMCELLLERGAQVDSLDDDDNTALHYAATSGSVASVTILLRNGADVSMSQAQGLSAAHWAAHKGHTDVLNVLLAYGASVNAKAEHGATPIHLAANRGHLPTVRLLLEHGADSRIYAKSWDGVEGTPSMMASAKSHGRVFKVIDSWQKAH